MTNSEKDVLNSEREIAPYELFMLLLSGYSLVALAFETFFHLPDNEIAILDTIDNVVCVFFMIDFATCLKQAENKLQYLKWGWIDLVSSIPIIDQFRAGRIVRVIRILRVLRGIRIARVLARYLTRNRTDGTFLAVIFLSFLILLLSSIAILHVEQVEASNIQTPSDALWWGISTMTTVGYGDKFPVTDVGRVIASILMICGVGLFGTLSGSVASWILKPVERRQEIDLDAIQTELAEIQRRLDILCGDHQPDPQLAKLIDAWPSLSEELRHRLAEGASRK